MKQEHPGSVERITNYVGTDVDLIVDEFASIEMPLTTEQMSELRLNRAQFVVDAIATELIRKEQKKINDEERLSAHFTETMPRTLDDPIGLEHIRYVIDALGYTRRYSAVIFTKLRRNFTQRSNRSFDTRGETYTTGVKRRYEEDDPTMARILKEGGYVKIVNRQVAEKHSQSRYTRRELDGTLLFTYGDVRKILEKRLDKHNRCSSGLGEGEKTDKAFEEMCGVFDLMMLIAQEELSSV